MGLDCAFQFYKMLCLKFDFKDGLKPTVFKLSPFCRGLKQYFSNHITKNVIELKTTHEHQEKRGQATKNMCKTHEKGKKPQKHLKKKKKTPHLWN